MPFPAVVDPLVDFTTKGQASQMLGVQRITVGPIWRNVKSDEFAGGAKGDGLTDDTSAIQAALTATSAAGGGTVFFPPGTYVCTGTLNVGGTVGVILQGAGGRSGGAATATLLRYTPSAGTRFIDGRASAGLCIRDMYI